MHSWWRSLLCVSVILSLQGCGQLLSLDEFNEATDGGDGGADDATGGAGWCAIVRASDGAVWRSFCPAELGAHQRCVSTGLPCTDAENDSAYHAETGQVPWYQAALDWASANGASDVHLEAGILTIDKSNLLPGEGGVGLRVPRGIALHGSTEPGHPTVIQAVDSVSLLALVLVSSSTSSQATTEIDHLTLVGTSAPGLSLAEDCPTQGLTITSIHEVTDPPPSLPTQTVPHSVYGVHIGDSPSGSGPVNVHHLRIAHVNTGIQYGRKTSSEPKVTGCETDPCVTLEFSPGQGSCQPDDYVMNLRLPGDTSARAYCVHLNPVASCTPTYCANLAHEFQGNTAAHSVVFNNAICDTNVGINLIGGQIDVLHNVVLRSFGGVDGVGLSSDGHQPHSSNTLWTENYVYGHTTGFLGDGVPYVSISDASFKQVTGYDRSAFVDARDVLALRRIITDMASAYAVSQGQYDGFIDHVRLNNNRFIVGGGRMGVAFYRTNFAWVGFNVIRAVNGVTASAGVLFDDTINSWVYGNTIKNVTNGIQVSGDPGKKSPSGSCWDGIGVNWDEVTKEFTSLPNNFQDVTCTVYYGVNYCIESAATSAVCEH